MNDMRKLMETIEEIEEGQPSYTGRTFASSDRMVKAILRDIKKLLDSAQEERTFHEYPEDDHEMLERNFKILEKLYNKYMASEIRQG